jgi:hypothetical protein
MGKLGQGQDFNEGAMVFGGEAPTDLSLRYLKTGKRANLLMPRCIKSV